jgi:hypothetical protein
MIMGAANAQNSGIMHETSTLGRSEVRERVARLATAKLTYELAAKTSAANATSDRSAQNEILAIKAFKKAGCGLIETQTDALTYDKWIEKGLKVKPGEKSAKVKNLRLFHKGEVLPIAETEKAETKAKAVTGRQTASREAKVIAISEGANPQT